MADPSPEHELLIEENEELNISLVSSEKNLNMTERTTLLDMSLSVCEPTEEAPPSPIKDSEEKQTTQREALKSVTEEPDSKPKAADNVAEAPDSNAKCSDDKADGTCAQKIHAKKELKKSLSYGGLSSNAPMPSKQKVKHSFSVNPNDVNAAKLSKSLNIAVFLKEGTGRLLLLENGKQTTAGEVKEMMIDNLALPDEAKDVFALWLISPLLELQLKSQHVPFRLRRQWKELLKRFSTAKEEEIEKDEPVLVFQRNSFLSVAEERNISDERIIRRLFEEAKLNILKGRYRIANADAEVLGAYLARIEHGKFDRDVHKIGFFKKSLQEYLPASAVRRQWLSKTLFSRLNSVEQNLIDQYSFASERADDPKKFYRLFLEYCWKLPFYGFAFFKGQVEQQSHDKYPWKHHTMNVSIGIGREGITLFKENKTEILINLTYDELSWDYSQSADDDGDNGVDSFCIEYDTVAIDGRHIAKQLQIFSPQAAMMDALVDSCVAEMDRLKIPKSPTSPVFTEEGKPLADQGPPNVNRDPKRNFSLSNPFKFR